MDSYPYFLLLVGLVLLVGGAEFFVRGASKLAAMIGVSPLVIGLTVVAYGTSLPELAVSMQSSLNSLANISLGNVVGSNIANILLILGLSALVAPLVVAQQMVRLDVPIMIGVSALTLGLAWNGVIGRAEGLLLFAGIVFYTAFLIIQSRRETAAVAREYEAEYGEAPPANPSSWLVIALQVLGGLGVLILGSRFLVDAAVTLAEVLGVSDLVIGLTIVAVGTSLPELATSVVASFRGERDIAVGNVVGSNIFNLLMVLGLSAALSPGGMPVAAAALQFDIPVMIGVAVACLPIFLTGRIERWGGVLFLGYYAAYVAYLALRAANHVQTALFGRVVLEIALPVTAVWLVWVGFRAWRGRRPVGNPG